jgi:urease accessory protein
MSHRYRSITTILALGLLPAVAAAHPGHGTPDFAAGLIHPLTGVDHLLAMVAVGWWSASTQMRRWWLVPTAFASGTLLGALAGLAGLVLPATETAIALTLVVLGALMLFKQRLSLPAAVLLAGGLALFHGYAHGHEMSPSIDALSWLGGMVLATLGLHLCGAALGLATRSRPWALRTAGAAVALAGAVLLVAPNSL